MKRSTALAECPFYSHPDFLAFCIAWERDGEIPPPLSDWLRDREWEAFADAAQWVREHPPLLRCLRCDGEIWISDGDDTQAYQYPPSIWLVEDVPATITLPLSYSSAFGDDGLGLPPPIPAFTSFPEAAANLLRAVACAHAAAPTSQAVITESRVQPGVSTCQGPFQ